MNIKCEQASTAVVALLLLQSPAAGRTHLAPENYSCGSWTAERKIGSATSFQLQSWVAGYLSGINAQLPSTTKDFLLNTDGEAVFGAIDNYCQANPLKNISEASIIVLNQLLKLRR